MKINNYWESKRHNETYRKVLTKHNKRLRDKRILAFMAIWFISIAINAVASSSNSFNINGAVVSYPEAGAFVEQESGAVNPPVAVSLPVMVETEKSNEMQIREIAKEFGFKWTDWLTRLAKCESGLKEKISNDKGNTPAGSIDRGIFQINDYWHSEVSDECSYDLRCSTIWTIQRVNAGYQSEWVCNNKI